MDENKPSSTSSGSLSMNVSYDSEFLDMLQSPGETFSQNLDSRTSSSLTCVIRSSFSRKRVSYGHPYDHGDGVATGRFAAGRQDNRVSLREWPPYGHAFSRGPLARPASWRDTRSRLLSASPRPHMQRGIPYHLLRYASVFCPFTRQYHDPKSAHWCHLRSAGFDFMPSVGHAGSYPAFRKGGGGAGRHGAAGLSGGGRGVMCTNTFVLYRIACFLQGRTPVFSSSYYSTPPASGRAADTNTDATASTQDTDHNQNTPIDSVQRELHRTEPAPSPVSRTTTEMHLVFGRGGGATFRNVIHRDVETFYRTRGWSPQLHATMGALLKSLPVDNYGIFCRRAQPPFDAAMDMQHSRRIPLSFHSISHMVPLPPLSECVSEACTGQNNHQQHPYGHSAATVTSPRGRCAYRVAASSMTDMPHTSPPCCDDAGEQDGGRVPTTIGDDGSCAEGVCAVGTRDRRDAAITDHVDAESNTCALAPHVFGCYVCADRTHWRNAVLQWMCKWDTALPPITTTTTTVMRRTHCDTVLPHHSRHWMQSIIPDWCVGESDGGDDDNTRCCDTAATLPYPFRHAGVPSETTTKHTAEERVRPSWLDSQSSYAAPLPMLSLPTHSRVIFLDVPFHAHRPTHTLPPCGCLDYVCHAVLMQLVKGEDAPLSTTHADDVLTCEAADAPADGVMRRRRMGVNVTKCAKTCEEDRWLMRTKRAAAQIFYCPLEHGIDYRAVEEIQAYPVSAAASSSATAATCREDVHSPSCKSGYVIHVDRPVPMLFLGMEDDCPSAEATLQDREGDAPVMAPSRGNGGDTNRSNHFDYSNNNNNSNNSECANSGMQEEGNHDGMRGSGEDTVASEARDAPNREDNTHARVIVVVRNAHYLSKCAVMRLLDQWTRNGAGLRHGRGSSRPAVAAVHDTCHDDDTSHHTSCNHGDGGDGVSRNEKSDVNENDGYRSRRDKEDDQDIGGSSSSSNSSSSSSGSNSDSNSTSYASPSRSDEAWRVNHDTRRRRYCVPFGAVQGVFIAHDFTDTAAKSGDCISHHPCRTHPSTAHGLSRQPPLVDTQTTCACDETGGSVGSTRSPAPPRRCRVLCRDTPVARRDLFFLEESLAATLMRVAPALAHTTARAQVVHRVVHALDAALAAVPASHAPASRVIYKRYTLQRESGARVEKEVHVELFSVDGRQLVREGCAALLRRVAQPTASAARCAMMPVVQEVLLMYPFLTTLYCRHALVRAVGLQLRFDAPTAAASPGWVDKGGEATTRRDAALTETQAQARVRVQLRLLPSRQRLHALAHDETERLRHDAEAAGRAGCSRLWRSPSGGHTRAHWAALLCSASRARSRKKGGGGGGGEGKAEGKGDGVVRLPCGRRLQRDAAVCVQSYHSCVEPPVLLGRWTPTAFYITTTGVDRVRLQHRLLRALQRVARASTTLVVCDVSVFVADDAPMPSSRGRRWGPGGRCVIGIRARYARRTMRCVEKEADSAEEEAEAHMWAWWAHVLRQHVRRRRGPLLFPYTAVRERVRERGAGMGWGGFVWRRGDKVKTGDRNGNTSPCTSSASASSHTSARAACGLGRRRGRAEHRFDAQTHAVWECCGACVPMVTERRLLVLCTTQRPVVRLSWGSCVVLCNDVIYYPETDSLASTTSAAVTHSSSLCRRQACHDESEEDSETENADSHASGQRGSGKGDEHTDSSLAPSGASTRNTWVGGGLERRPVMRVVPRGTICEVTGFARLDGCVRDLSQQQHHSSASHAVVHGGSSEVQLLSDFVAMQQAATTVPLLRVLRWPEGGSAAPASGASADSHTTDSVRPSCGGETDRSGAPAHEPDTLLMPSTHTTSTTNTPPLRARDAENTTTAYRAAHGRDDMCHDFPLLPQPCLIGGYRSLDYYALPTLHLPALHLPGAASSHTQPASPPAPPTIFGDQHGVARKEGGHFRRGDGSASSVSASVAEPTRKMSMAYPACYLFHPYHSDHHSAAMLCLTPRQRYRAFLSLLPSARRTAAVTRAPHTCSHVSCSGGSHASVTCSEPEEGGVARHDAFDMGRTRMTMTVRDACSREGGGDERRCAGAGSGDRDVEADFMGCEREEPFGFVEDVLFEETCAQAEKGAPAMTRSASISRSSGFDWRTATSASSQHTPPMRFTMGETENTTGAHDMTRTSSGSGGDDTTCTTSSSPLVRADSHSFSQMPSLTESGSGDEAGGRGGRRVCDTAVRAAEPRIVLIDPELTELSLFTACLG